MIINNTHFVNEYYIPHAKPSITADVTTVSAEIDSFITRYVKECLNQCLGTALADEFVYQLKTEPSDMSDLLKDASAQKWRELMYGKEYVCDGIDKKWRGIVFEDFGQPEEGGIYKSFLTPYVYWMYEQNADSFRGGAANAVPNVKNAIVVSKNSKVTKAFRDFIEFVQGKDISPGIYNKGGLIGVDWYSDGANSEVTLYQYLEDKTKLLDGLDFDNYQPRAWKMPNQFGI